MLKPVKVYNKGTRPVVYKRDRTGIDAIHPRKFKTFAPSFSDAIIDMFEDACSEKDYEKHLEEVSKKRVDAKEKYKIKTTSKK